MTTSQQTLAQMFGKHVPTGACQPDPIATKAICSTEGGDPLCSPGTFTDGPKAFFGAAICSTEGGDPVCHGVQAKAMCETLGPINGGGPSAPVPNCMIGPMVARSVTDELPNFDLASVVARVAKENPTLSDEILMEGEASYRQFLRSAKLNPAAKNSPNLLVDEFWHSHMLHSEQYVQDCAAYFGYYFHHRPTS
jgi:hypothetical protein